MTGMGFIRRISAMTGAAALAFVPVVAEAQQACMTEAEVSAITIYSVPSLVQALQLRCGSELSPNGFLAQDGQRLSARYARLQNQVWPTAKSGMLKMVAAKAAGGGQDLSSFATLPDDAVRPLVDAFIVQEASPRIAIKDCQRIERMIAVASPIDPEIAGTLIGGIVTLADPEEIPVCPATKS